MSQEETLREIARYAEQVDGLRADFVNQIAAHCERSGRVDPQIILSALGSTALDLMLGLRQTALPPRSLGILCQASASYFHGLADQLATIAAAGAAAGAAARATPVAQTALAGSAGDSATPPWLHVIDGGRA